MALKSGQYVNVELLVSGVPVHLWSLHTVDPETGITVNAEATYAAWPIDTADTECDMPLTPEQVAETERAFLGIAALSPEVARLEAACAAHLADPETFRLLLWDGFRCGARYLGASPPQHGGVLAVAAQMRTKLGADQFAAHALNRLRPVECIVHTSWDS